MKKVVIMDNSKVGGFKQMMFSLSYGLTRIGKGEYIKSYGTKVKVTLYSGELSENSISVLENERGIEIKNNPPHYAEIFASYTSHL